MTNLVWLSIRLTDKQNENISIEDYQLIFKFLISGQQIDGDVSNNELSCS